MAKPRLPKNPNNPKTTIPAATTSASNPEIGKIVEPAESSPAVSAATTKTAPKKVVRMPEIVKTEPRTNLVPINLEEEIRRFAYLLAERRGFEPGHDAEDWLKAEHEIRQRYHQHSA